MKFSKRCEYALRALVEMAARPSALHTINRISKAQNIPPKFLEQILLALRQGGLLTSRRGVGGGYSFQIAPSVIRLGDVVRAMDGDPFGLSIDSPRTSSGSPVDQFIADIEKDIIAKLDSTTIEDLLHLADELHGHSFDI